MDYSPARILPPIVASVKLTDLTVDPKPNLDRLPPPQKYSLMQVKYGVKVR